VKCRGLLSEGGIGGLFGGSGRWRGGVVKAGWEAGEEVLGGAVLARMGRRSDLGVEAKRASSDDAAARRE